MRPKEIKIYTIDEAKTLLSTLKHVQFKYQIFFTLAMLTGLRRGEILGLEWNDFDFDKMQRQDKADFKLHANRGYLYRCH